MSGTPPAGHRPPCENIPMDAAPLSPSSVPDVLAPVPDVLGPQWQSRTLRLSPDANPTPPVATLVSRRPATTGRRAVLYIHGFVDYFFQTHHAETWEASGFSFYALDLRDYGRSIRPGRRPNWVLDMATYDEEIGAAIAQVCEDHEEVVLAGHSTGGLIVSLFADRYPDLVAGVVLNSPWLDLNEPWFMRRVAAPFMRWFGPLVPDVPVSHLGSEYGQSLHVSTGGSWEYDLAWKPIDGFGVRAGWLAAILTGHRAIARGLTITAPVLMATSGARGDNNHPSALELDTTDVVLSPPQMWRRAGNLGRDVTVIRVNGGRHDLTLSTPAPRERFARELSAWLTRRFPIP